MDKFVHSILIYKIIYCLSIIFIEMTSFFWILFSEEFFNVLEFLPVDNLYPHYQNLDHRSQDNFPE